MEYLLDFTIKQHSYLVQYNMPNNHIYSKLIQRKMIIQTEFQHSDQNNMMFCIVWDIHIFSDLYDGVDFTESSQSFEATL